MPFDSLGNYTANHKTWDHVGNLIPQVERCEGTRPHYEFKPAAWLPVKFYDKHYENWNVVLPGKAVACDPDGNLMPAEYGLATGSGTVVYTANDVNAGVIDIATGLPVTAAKTVVLSQLTGVRGSAYARDTAGTAGATNVSAFLGRFGAPAWDDTAKRYPIGLASYAYLQWAGGDGFNPSEYDKHNYNMQHQTAIVCDYVVNLPLVPSQEANETVSKTVAGAALVIATDGTHTRANVQANLTGRYAAATGSVPVLSTYPVIALALDEAFLAKQTTRTPLVLSSTNDADDLSSILVAEKTDLAAVTAAGDYFVDYQAGVIFIYSADGATVPTAISGAAGTVRVTYYRNKAAPGVLSVFASVLGGDIKAGDFLKVGPESNLVVADPTSLNFADIVGQVLALDNNYPKDSMERVRTAYNPALNTNAAGGMSAGVASGGNNNLGQLDQMPGSANGGYPDQISYAGAADTIVVVNLVSR